MSRDYIERAIEPVLKKAAREFPVVVLSGPRQSGKTTVLQHLPVEIKLSATPRPAMADTILSLKRDLGQRIGPGYVVHLGDIRLPLAPGVTALPSSSL